MYVCMCVCVLTRNAISRDEFLRRKKRKEKKMRSFRAAYTTVGRKNFHFDAVLDEALYDTEMRSRGDRTFVLIKLPLVRPPDRNRGSARPPAAASSTRGNTPAL